MAMSPQPEIDLTKSKEPLLTQVTQTQSSPKHKVETPKVP